MASPRPRCGGPEHAKAVNLAFFAILLYPIGIPALYLLLLFCARGAILRDRPTRLSSALSFLHRDFEARMYGWEIAEQFKKLFLVGIMVRVRPDTIVQLGVAIIFCLVFMLGSAIAKPYRREENDYFAVACNFSLTAVFVFCTMLKVKTVSETMDPGELYDRLYFDEFIIGACLFVCVFGALVLAAALSVQSIIEAAQVPTFRLLSTGNRPDLALAKGHKWHLFLSHIWGTGQDQCATIKRQLSLLLTGVSVFLDVDDLEDIGALEEYIEKTAVIMIFVSKGYFKSKNCLREVKGTLKMKKPLSLVHDPVRGGAPLKTIMDDECPPEYFTDVFKDFGKDRNVIIFHRIKDFQVVSVELPPVATPTHIYGVGVWKVSIRLLGHACTHASACGMCTRTNGCTYKWLHMRAGEHQAPRARRAPEQSQLRPQDRQAQEARRGAPRQVGRAARAAGRAHAQAPQLRAAHHCVRVAPQPGRGCRNGGAAGRIPQAAGTREQVATPCTQPAALCTQPAVPCTQPPALRT